MAFRDRSYASSWFLIGVGFSLALALTACEEPLKLPGRSLGAALGDAGTTGTGPTALAKSGEKCSGDPSCESGHCNHDVCCDSGECCRKPADCMTDGGMGAVCNDMSTCQGTRGAVKCDDFRCQVDNGAEDDSACTEDMIADTCGLYASAFCNGKAKQSTPKCLTNCADDKDCDQDAHCQSTECVPDLPEGTACVGNGDCLSNHCDRGVCCATGACCNTVADCADDQYRTAATCDTPIMCQGTRGDPACEAHQCTTKKVNDDSACDGTIVASECSGGTQVKCSGDRVQRTPPPCPAEKRCYQDNDCDRTAFCMIGACVPDHANGESCTTPAMCQSGHCEGSLCCTYDCCDMKNRCPGAPCTEATNCSNE